MGNRPFSRKICNFFCKLTAFWGRTNSLSQNLTAVYPFRLFPLVAATFPKGTASEVAAKFPARRKGVPLGELANVVSLRGYSPRAECIPNHPTPHCILPRRMIQ